VRNLFFMAAAVVAAAVFFLLATLPPSPFSVSLDGVDRDLLHRTIRGAYHIHTTRSDGAESKAAIATAAARAGLQFAIFTDHGDGTRAPDPPAYIDGVLCIDGVEISTNGGHYVALDLPPAPYPLGGEAAAVVEDVRRLGGFGIAAHPDHPKQELAWTDWSVPIDGVEWLNADAEWRTEGRLALARTLFAYLFRPGPALASIFDRPTKTLERWDAASRTRQVIALAAVDAHGGAWAPSGENGASRVMAGPSYDASFKALSNRVVVPRPLRGDAALDARAVVGAVRAGLVYSVIDAISPDVVLNVDPQRISPASSLPAGADAAIVRGESGQRLEIRAPHAPGDPPIPWVLTNWVAAGGQRTRPAEPADTVPDSIPPVPTGDWHVEKDAPSAGQVTSGGSVMALSYELAGNPRRSQYVAAALPISQPQPFGAIAFVGKASRPMRVSVQLRFPEEDGRWVKSVYLDEHPRDIVVRVTSLKPAERSGGAMPSSSSARSLLFVVDLVNARPGDRGELRISDLRLGR
jgi:hypothetical protein